MAKPNGAASGGWVGGEMEGESKRKQRGRLGFTELGSQARWIEGFQFAIMSVACRRKKAGDAAGSLQKVVRLLAYGSCSPFC
jgi:hypothetical protein